MQYIALLRYGESYGTNIQEFETNLPYEQLRRIVETNPAGFCKLIFDYDSFGDEDSVNFFTAKYMHVPVGEFVKLRLTE